jgi:hypothetical protein
MTTASPPAPGDIGELVGDGLLVRHGAKVFVPLGHSPDVDPDVDLVADFGDRLVRAQVKTSTAEIRQRWTCRFPRAVETGAGAVS